MNHTSIEQTIQSRRSIRQFTNASIKPSSIWRLLHAACMAPSGKNNQPWRFAVIQEDVRLLQAIAAMSQRAWVQTAPCMIAVFRDKRASYSRDKDMQSIGAAIQNILLTAHDMGIGTCWIGELNQNERQIKALLGLEEPALELTAFIALGIPAVFRPDMFTRRPDDAQLLCWK